MEGVGDSARTGLASKLLNVHAAALPPRRLAALGNEYHDLWPRQHQPAVAAQCSGDRRGGEGALPLLVRLA